MRTPSFCLIVPALALAACNSSSHEAEQAAAAAAIAQQQAEAAAAGAAQPSTPETLFSIGGGPAVSVGSVSEIQFDNPYEGLTFSSLRRIEQNTWETDTGFRANETTKTADGFVLAESGVQIVVDLALAEVKVTVGSDHHYGPYDIVLAR